MSENNVPFVTKIFYKIILTGIFAFLVLSLNNCYSQDTVKVMHYNILNYGNNTGYCNSTNNNIDDKESRLKKILQYAKPDILTVNEIAANTYVHQRLLDSTLNVEGINFYAKAVYSNNAGSNIVNMLYYDTTKFVLHSQDLVHPVTVRDIDIYKLYHKTPDLSITLDTTFLFCIVAHLNAGNSPQDAARRATMTFDMMNYLENNYQKTNVMFLGDYNTYTSSETAYQNLINYPNPDYRFYDPINRAGNWNNNSSFADVHTQSTHSSSNGCASGGGMDDRFDQILISEKILNGSKKIEYIQGSYKAIGQDGLHFNNSINSSPVNTSVPPDVLNALYNLSDHLPVTLDLRITGSASNIKDQSLNNIIIEYENPVYDILNISIKEKYDNALRLEIYSSTGKNLYTQIIHPGINTISFDLTSYSKGMFFLIIKDNASNFSSYKFVKI